MQDRAAMESYYQHAFPFRQLFLWLNHSPIPSNDFANREFALVGEGGRYMRYLAYKSGDQLKKDVLKILPERFEVGCVYTSNPLQHKTLPKSLFRPLSKELVFDIDLTDYDPVRTCCQKTDICSKCWQFITIAMKVLDAALTNDFGFQHILWVYSGRRGAHAWVCDESARNMSDESRKAIVNYIKVIGTGKRGRSVDLRRPLHPHLTRSLGILKEYFPKVVIHDQDPWRTKTKAQELLDSLELKPLTDALKEKWGDEEISSAQRWRDIDEVAASLKGFSKKEQLMERKQDILFEYLYPRLDDNVSKHLHHLLKSPFCVHPGTGRVCVPIDPALASLFEPEKVPTVKELMVQIQAEGKAASSTSLGPSRCLFEVCDSPQQDKQTTSRYFGLLIHSASLDTLDIIYLLIVRASRYIGL